MDLLPAWGFSPPCHHRFVNYLTGALGGVSRFEVELFRKHLHLPAERFAIIQNGAELPEASPDQAPVAAGAPLVVSIGRLERYKGHHLAVQALPLLRERLPGARLLILGSGPYERELRKLALRLGVAAAVEIVSIPPAERGRLAATLRRTPRQMMLDTGGSFA